MELPGQHRADKTGMAGDEDFGGGWHKQIQVIFGFACFYIQQMTPQYIYLLYL